MKTFRHYVYYKEALVADNDKGADPINDQEIFDILNSIMKEAWIEDPRAVINSLRKLNNINKYESRISELEKRKSSPYGRGIDKPDDRDDVVQPTSDQSGDEKSNSDLD